MLTASDPKGEKPESITSPESAIADFYEDARVPGQVIGSFSPTGVCRQGRDVERQISIDHQALRFQPLLNPGWGRQGIVYGPYTRQNGLALAVFLLNGHNTSQIERLEPLGKRFKQWLRGAAQAEYWDWPRLKPWIASFQKYWMGRRVVWWIKATAQFSRYFKWPRLDENLAVGWFSQDVPLDPITTGNTLVIHATGAKNGELWARVGKQMLRVVQGLQNLQIYYVVILRERGAAYYGATVPNARGLAAYPNLRPLGIDPFNQDTPLYGGVYQSILGQFGFRVDTRVYGTQITPVTGLNTWYGTAQMADRLRGTGDLSENLAEVGGQWQVISGHYERTALGTRAIQADSLATTRLAQPPGLIHVLVRTPAQVAGVKLLWRIQDQHHFWCLWAESDRCCLGLQVGDCWRVVAASELWFLLPDQLNSLQILDEGHTFSLYLNGRLLFNKWFIEPRFQDATGVGLATVKPDPDLLFQDFEVHPRQIPLPPELNLGSPWIPGEMPIAILEDFTGEPGDLEGHSITGGQSLTLSGVENWVLGQSNSREPEPPLFRLVLPLLILAVQLTPWPGRTRSLPIYRSTLHLQEITVGRGRRAVAV